jgi:hypothetical protein
MRLSRLRTRRPRPDRRCGDRRPPRGPATRPAWAARRARLVRSCTVRAAVDESAARAVRSAERRRLLLIVELVALGLVVTGSAQAEPATVLAQVSSVDQVLVNIRNWLMGILAGLATVFLSIGGVRRVMAGGDPGEHEKAKECFKAAGIGYCLAALAPLVVTVLQGIVGV